MLNDRSHAAAHAEKKSGENFRQHEWLPSAYLLFLGRKNFFLPNDSKATFFSLVFFIFL